MQAYLNIASPCAGTMFQANTWHGRHVFAVPPRGRLGVECEIAVRLARDLIADDFFHYTCVLGPPSESTRPEALRDVTATMTINGLQVGSGVGTDILGEPLQVLCWLANNAAAWGTPLLAGDVILLGSLVQTQWVQPATPSP
jgi:2-keto-4-pentenoate hydratase